MLHFPLPSPWPPWYLPYLKVSRYTVLQWLPYLLFTSDLLFLPSRPQTLSSNQTASGEIPIPHPMQCRNIPLPSRANPASARHRLFKASPGSISALFRRKIAHCLDPWPRLALALGLSSSPPSHQSDLTTSPLFSTACVDLQANS